MTHETGHGDVYDLDELLGAYALDAVDDGERERVEDYLRINPRAAEEVARHREVATMLAFTGMDAPHGVWSRIESEIEATAPEPGPELAKVFALERPEPSQHAIASQNSQRRATNWFLGAAAAIALVVTGAAVVTGLDSGSGGDPLADAFAAAQDDRGSITTELVADGSEAIAVGVIDQDGHGYLDASGLPELGSDQTYQLWGVLVDSSDVVSLGILGNRPALEPFTSESDVAALAITIEDSPGVISDGNPDGAFVGSF